MILAKVFNSIYQNRGGIILIDYYGNQYICGSPDKNKPIKEILFNPEKDNKSFYLCNIPLKNNKMFCEKDKSEILNNQIIEMRYSPDNSEDMLWTPLRVRTDKENPQFFITANKIWKTIINPVTTELITGLEEVYNIKDKILESDEKSKYQYYVEESLREDDHTADISLRKLHNFIKNSFELFTYT